MATIGGDYPTLALHGAVADFDHHLADLPRFGQRMFVLLGSTLGNYPPAQRDVFLSNLSTEMAPDETLLLDIDLVKDPARLVAAYDDTAGVTGELNRNVLAGPQPRARRRLRSGGLRPRRPLGFHQ